MIDHPGVCQQVAEMGMERFTDPLLEEVAAALIRLNDMGEMPSVTGLLDEKPDDPDWAAAVAEIGQMWCEVREITKAVTQLIASLEVPYVKRQIDGLRARMRTERSVRDTMEITGDIQRLGKRLEELHGVLHDGDG